MDRRRLECGHFRYAVLHVVKWYSEYFKDAITFSSDDSNTLLKITPTYQRAFCTKYSGIHLYIIILLACLLEAYLSVCQTTYYEPYHQMKFVYLCVHVYADVGASMQMHERCPFSRVNTACTGCKLVFLNHSSHSSKLSCFSGHRCNKPGCGSVLVVDGNMKNHRAVCAATEAGYIEYAGLPKSVKSGCTNTPDQISRFCSLHKPRALMPKHCHSNDTNKVIELILEKKSTRSQNFYKVR